MKKMIYKFLFWWSLKLKHPVIEWGIKGRL